MRKDAALNVPGRCVPSVIAAINETIDDEATAEIKALPDVLARLSACVMQKLAPADDDVAALKAAAGLGLEDSVDAVDEST